MQKTLELIKRFEGFKERPYFATKQEQDRGLLTIGYGFTYLNGRKVLANDRLTPEQADSILIDEIEEISYRIKIHLPNLTENQNGSLVSLAFNVGVPTLLNSTLVKRIKANDNILIDLNNFTRLKKDIIQYSDRIKIEEFSEFHRWIYQGGKSLFGLLKRREAEYKLFKTKG